MSKVYNAGDVLAASDLNTNTMQPHTAGTGTRIVSGKTAFTLTAAISVPVTVSYGVTFSALTSFNATIQSASNIDMVATMNGAPTTSSAAVRASVMNSSSQTVSGNVHWIAIGTP